MRQTVASYRQRNPATLLNSRSSTAFIMSIFRRLHEYSGPTTVRRALVAELKSPPQDAAARRFRVQVGEDLLDDVGLLNSAMIRTAVPQAGQVSTSIPETA